MSDLAVVGRFLAGFAEASQPLRAAFGSAQEFTIFLGKLGWTVEAGIDLDGVRQAFGSLPSELEAFAAAVPPITRALESADASAVEAAVTAAIPAVKAVIATVKGLAEPTATAALPQVLKSPAFWASFPVEVLDYLVYRYLQQQVPSVFVPMRILGVLTVVPLQDPDRGEVDKLVVHWERLAQLFTDPAGTLRDTYGWSTKLDQRALLQAVSEAANAAGLATAVAAADAAHTTLCWGDVAPAEPLGEVELPLWGGLLDAGDTMALVSLGLSVLPIPAKGDQSGVPVGFAVVPEARGSVASQIGVADGITLEVGGSVGLAGGIRIEFRPTGVDVAFGASDEASGEVALKAQPAKPWIAIGSENSSRFEVAQAHLSLKAEQAVGTAFEVTVEAGLDSAQLVIEPGDVDGFLHTVLGGQKQQIDIAALLAWSNRTGFTLNGRLGFTTEIPIHQTLAGVVTVDAVTVSLIGDLQTGEAKFSITFAGALALGPVAASVKGVGMNLTIAPPAQGKAGSVGPVDLSVGYQHPTAVGLTIDSGPLTGGGFLDRDDAKQQYAGVLQLGFEGLLNVTAIGLLTTQLPDGSPGYSLLIVITATGFTPIQLGFGFTLTGVGGIVGVHRSVDEGVLESGIRSGNLDTVLFPADPITHAPQIVSTLASVFPSTPGRYVFGPMAQIGWGTPTIVTIELAIVVEVPAPVRIILLGELKAVLPDADHPIVELVIDVAGSLDFGTRTLAIDASLRHPSRVLNIALSGDLALRMSWGSEPSFALAIGGFHPKFRPPPGFPANLRRMSASLTGAGLTARLDAYLALTSNTAQVGAHLDLEFSGGGFDAKGHLGFDALFQFSPFMFVIDIDASVSISWEGINLLAVALHLELSGPSPWHAVGSATLDLGWLPSVTVGFDVQIGSAAPQPAPPAVDVGALLHAAIADPRNWGTPLPADQQALVSAAPADIDGAVRLHPLAGLEIRQRVAPLNTYLQRFGNAPLAAPTTFRISGLKVGTADVAYQTLDDDFAAAQFATLSDDEKLTRPSFEQMPAGARVEAGAATHGVPVAGVLDYETHVMSDDDPSPLPAGVTPLSAETVAAAAPAGAVARAAAATGSGRWSGQPQSLAVSPITYQVASRETLVAAANVTAQPTSYVEAAAALDAYLQATPADREALQIVPRHLVGV